MFSKFIFIIQLLSCSLSYGLECSTALKVKTYQPKYARFFSIDYYDTYKIIHSNKKDYLLSDKLNIVNCVAQTKIQTPVTSFAMTSTTYLSTLVLLDKVDTLKAFQGKEYIFSDKFQKEKIQNLGMEIKIEELISNKINVLMGYNDNLRGFKKIGILNKFNINFVENNDLLEQHPLARAEWMIFIASFYNKENEAIELFNQIANHYTLMQKNAKKIKSPRVLIGEIQNGRWVMPGGKSDLANLIKDAGGELVFSNDKKETQFISLEKIFKENISVDIWITNNNWKNVKELKADTRYGRIKYKYVVNFNKQINSNGSNNYWEMGLQRPDLLLQDLNYMFTTDSLEDSKLNWYRVL